MSENDNADNKGVDTSRRALLKAGLAGGAVAASAGVAAAAGSPDPAYPLCSKSIT